MNVFESAVANHSCRECGEKFPEFLWEQTFRARIDAGPPKFCPTCRSRRRLAHVNQVNLFRVTSAASGKSIIANFPPDSPIPVFEQAHWHSDDFDGTLYGRDYDASRSFFEQFNELQLVVPRPCLATEYLVDENCPYTNFSGKNRNSYLIFDSNACQDAYYCYGVNCGTDTFDCLFSHHLELCYELVGSRHCYASAFLSNSESCNDSLFLSNCIGCKNCILCSNLSQKEYYFRNAPSTPEEIARIRRQLHHADFLRAALQEFRELIASAPQKAVAGYKNEGVNGNFLFNSKDAHTCFQSVDLRDAMYCSQTFEKANDCLDCDECGGGELMFESCNSGLSSYDLRFCYLCCSNCHSLTYCQYCEQGTHHCFGCVGLRRKSYAILNKEYSPDEYHHLVHHIIIDMKARGEWGEFFPPSQSSVPFSLSQAAVHFPLSAAELARRGYRADASNQPNVSTAERLPVPPSFEEYPEGLNDAVFSCRSCSNGFKILSQEAAFLKKLGLPPPQSCFQCRHKDRLSLMPPRALRDAPCASCSAPIRTSFLPPRWKNVVCEACYLESLR